MAFIDDLAFELFTLVFAGVILLYMTLGVYYDYSKKGERNLEEHMLSGVGPLAIVGIVMILMGLYSEMTWPLSLGSAVPAAVEAKFQSYNILFYDPYMFAGIVIISYVISVKMKYKLQYVGILAHENEYSRHYTVILRAQRAGFKRDYGSRRGNGSF